MYRMSGIAHRLVEILHIIVALSENEDGN